METKLSVLDIDIVSICGAFRDLVPFVQFKKREKHHIWVKRNTFSERNSVLVSIVYLTPVFI